MADDPLHEFCVQSNGVAYHWGAGPQIGVPGVGTRKALHGDGPHIPEESFLYEGLFFPSTSQSGRTSSLPGDST